MAQPPSLDQALFEGKSEDEFFADFRYNKLRQYAVTYNERRENLRAIVPLAELFNGNIEVPEIIPIPLAELDQRRDSEELLCYLWNRNVEVPSMNGLTFGEPYDEIFKDEAQVYTHNDEVNPDINECYLYPFLKHWQQLPGYLSCALPNLMNNDDRTISDEFNMLYLRLGISGGKPLKTYKDIIDLVSKLLKLDRLDLLYLVYATDRVFSGGQFIEHMTMHGYYLNRVGVSEFDENVEEGEEVNENDAEEE